MKLRLALTALLLSCIFLPLGAQTIQPTAFGNGKSATQDKYSIFVLGLLFGVQGDFSTTEIWEDESLYMAGISNRDNEMGIGATLGLELLFANRYGIYSDIGLNSYGDGGLALVLDIGVLFGFGGKYRMDSVTYWGAGLSVYQNNSFGIGPHLVYGIGNWRFILAYTSSGEQIHYPRREKNTAFFIGARYRLRLFAI